MMHTVYIGIGSNLDNPLHQASNALAKLQLMADCRVADRSPWYSSKAIGPGNQPDYINGVVKLETSLGPEELLDKLQDIERAQGRVRHRCWEPRTLDLDILLFDNLQLATARLRIPHPRLRQRNFVLYPLADVAPELALPGDGATPASLLAKCLPGGIVRLPAGAERGTTG